MTSKLNFKHCINLCKLHLLWVDPPEWTEKHWLGPLLKSIESSSLEEVRICFTLLNVAEDSFDWPALDAALSIERQPHLQKVELGWMDTSGEQFEWVQGNLPGLSQRGVLRAIQQAFP